MNPENVNDQIGIIPLEFPVPRDIIEEMEHLNAVHDPFEFVFVDDAVAHQGAVPDMDNEVVDREVADIVAVSANPAVAVVANQELAVLPTVLNPTVLSQTHRSQLNNLLNYDPGFRICQDRGTLLCTEYVHRYLQTPKLTAQMFISPQVAPIFGLNGFRDRYHDMLHALNHAEINLQLMANNQFLEEVDILREKDSAEAFRRIHERMFMANRRIRNERETRIENSADDVDNELQLVQEILDENTRMIKARRKQQYNELKQEQTIYNELNQNFLIHGPTKIEFSYYAALNITTALRMINNLLRYEISNALSENNRHQINLPDVVPLNRFQAIDRFIEPISPPPLV